MTFHGFHRLALLVLLLGFSVASSALAQTTNTNKLTIPAPATNTVKKPTPAKPVPSPKKETAPAPKAAKPTVPKPKPAPVPTKPVPSKPAPPKAKPIPAPKPAPTVPTPKKVVTAPAKTETGDFFKDLLKLVDNKPIGFSPGDSASLNLINPAKGAGGVVFGASMNDLIKVWGRPHSISMSTYDNEPLVASDITLHMSASRFRFLNNRLVELSLHRSNLPKAAFAKGVGFESSEADIISKLGSPRTKRINTLEYMISGTKVSIHLARHYKTGNVSPIAITLSRE